MLEPGTRLGTYEIGSSLGAGGMGEVYRATDTKLRRDVAIKILPDAFAQDAQRMKRFEREAQVLASLNHPNIAAIYGLEQNALVLELVEGPTLAERIQEGPIALDEALPLARQIAEALSEAHEKGIVHRDLKPANVKLTREGQIKVLDFGLAKALSEGSGEADGSSELSQSPTLSRQATAAGMILGTAAYMSPEQAKGKSRRPADGRLGVRSRALRDADGQASFRRRGRLGNARRGAASGARLRRSSLGNASGDSSTPPPQPREERA